MYFYIVDEKGYRNVWQGDDWRYVRRRAPAEPLRHFDDRPPKEEKQKPLKGFDSNDHLSPIEFEQQRWSKPRNYSPNSPVTARQVMQKNVIALGPKHTIKDAWELFERHRFRHVPITTPEKAVIGILSDRALSKAMITMPPETLIEDVMIQRVMTAVPETELARIAEVFINERIGAMPIVDGAGKLTGIVTRSDILRTLVRVVPTQLRV